MSLRNHRFLPFVPSPLSVVYIKYYNPSASAILSPLFRTSKWKFLSLFKLCLCGTPSFPSIFLPLPLFSFYFPQQYLPKIMHKRFNTRRRYTTIEWWCDQRTEKKEANEAATDWKKTIIFITRVLDEWMDDHHIPGAPIFTYTYTKFVMCRCAIGNKLSFPRFFFLHLRDITPRNVLFCFLILHIRA